MNISRLFDVTGLVTVVTGAASGLGLAMAEVMADSGAKVVLTDINAEGLAAIVSRMKAAGRDVEGRKLDVGNPEAIVRTVDDVAKAYGRLDVVFANAGVPTGPGYSSEAGKISGQVQNITMEDWNRGLQLNVMSVVATIKAAAPHMKAQKSGRIIVTASDAALRGSTLAGHPYSADKAAIAHLVRTTARELAPHNVLVNAICPGPFLTNIGDGRLHREPKVVEAFAALVPLGRIAQPQEMKGLALLLASPASSFISGAVIPIDGGSSA